MLPFEHQKINVNEAIVDMTEEGVGFAKRCPETLKKDLEQRPNDVLSHTRTIQALQKEISSHCLKDFHQPTIDSFFHLA